MANLMMGQFWLPLIALVVGAVHVLAPDHWIPGSVLFWRRGYGLRRTLLSSGGVLSLHVLAGLALAVLMVKLNETVFSSAWSTRELTIFSLVLALGILLFRMIRFSRASRVFIGPSHRIWGFLTILSFLGPAESLIPILVRSRGEGAGYLVPLAMYAVGTLAGGLFSMVFGRYLWDRPLMLPRAAFWVQRRRSLIPIATGVMIVAAAVISGVR